MDSLVDSGVIDLAPTAAASPLLPAGTPALSFDGGWVGPAS